MRTRDEWLAIFRGFGMDNGTVWHMMDGLYALGLVEKKQ